MAPRLLERYRTEIVEKLTTEFSYRNVNQVPKIEKVVINMGLGEAAANPKIIERAAIEMSQITGQKPSIRRARKSVSNFKLREEAFGVPPLVLYPELEANTGLPADVVECFGLDL